MAVHVGELHTDLTGSRPAGAGESPAEQGASAYPGAKEDDWRRVEQRVERLRCRVRAENFDD